MLDQRRECGTGVDRGVYPRERDHLLEAGLMFDKLHRR